MIGLAKDGYPVMGVVYQPTTDIMYYASEGSGAFKIEKEVKPN
jgi:fructose-1,6-bisphosphatase/inositol monophosphatase family enzyme